MKPFSKWTIVEVENTFQIVFRKQSHILKKWLDVRASPPTQGEKTLDILRERLLDHVYDWNEHELRAKFVIPLLLMVDFDQAHCQSFLEREISVSLGDETLAGVVGFVVARGRRVPERPYFFIHEYERELDPSGDPLGQLLIAMVAAQKLNDDENPIYGAYIMGRLWYFVMLDGLEYSVSLAHDATKDEIRDIFRILQNTKRIIEELTWDDEHVAEILGT